jgi:hypothetical protein
MGKLSKPADQRRLFCLPFHNNHDYAASASTNRRFGHPGSFMRDPERKGTNCLQINDSA